MSQSNSPNNRPPLPVSTATGAPTAAVPVAGMLNYQDATESAGFAAARSWVIAGGVLWIITSLPLLGFGGMIILQVSSIVSSDISRAAIFSGFLFSALFGATGIGCLCMGTGSLTRKPWAANGGAALAMILLTGWLSTVACIVTLLINFQYGSNLALWPIFILVFPLLVSGFLCYIHLRPSTAKYILSRQSHPSALGKNTVLSLYLTACDGLACLMSIWILIMFSDSTSGDAGHWMRLDLTAIAFGIALTLATYMRWKFAWALAVAFYGLRIWQIVANLHPELEEIAPHCLVLFAGLLTAHRWLNRSRATGSLVPLQPIVPTAEPAIDQSIPMASLNPPSHSTVAGKSVAPDHQKLSDQD